MVKQLKDDQIIQDILSTEKSLTKLYMDAILESNCPVMRDTLGNVHMEIAKNQFDCFTYMNQNNLYPVEYAENKKLTEAIDKFATL